MDIKPTRPDPEHRPLMSFTRIPVTKEAFDLVETIADEIIAGEQRQRQRREYDKIAFKDTLGRALGDLAITISQGPPNKYRAWPKNNNHYAKANVPVSRYHASDAYEGLKRLGYIRTYLNGSYQILPNGAKRGYCELVEIQDALHDRMAQARVLRDVCLHWAFDREADKRASMFPPIVVKQKTTKQVIPGREATSLGKFLTAEIAELNEFIDGVEITGTQLAGWQRIFFDDFEHGGRMYAKPGDTSYQQMPKGERAKLLFNGMPVNEIDLKASFLFIALAVRSVSLAERMKEYGLADPYSIPSASCRDRVKRYLTSAFGQEKHPSRWPQGTVAKLGYKPPKIQQVRDDVLRVYPELTSLNGVGWSELQLLESRSMLSAMQQLSMRGVPSFPVHDSLIVPVEATTMAEMYLEQACSSITGYCLPKLQVNRNDVVVVAKSIKETKIIDGTL